MYFLGPIAYAMWLPSMRFSSSWIYQHLHITWSHCAVASHFWATALCSPASQLGPRNKASEKLSSGRCWGFTWRPSGWCCHSCGCAKTYGTWSHEFCLRTSKSICVQVQHQLWMARPQSCYNTFSVRSANNWCIDTYSMQSGEYLCRCLYT